MQEQLSGGVTKLNTSLPINIHFQEDLVLDLEENPLKLKYGIGDITEDNQQEFSIKVNIEALLKYFQNRQEDYDQEEKKLHEEAKAKKVNAGAGAKTAPPAKPAASSSQ